ncbi:MAG: Rrf2 family transcriptional regulator [Patescibacteria group bacterium]
MIFVIRYLDNSLFIPDMRISTKTYYGLRAMINLVRKEEVSPIADIAFEEDIPFAFLEKIFQQLKRAGLVRSKKGSLGGYELARSPKEITAGQVFEALGEEVISSFCPGDSSCSRLNSCGTKDFLSKLESSIGQTLDSMTLERLAN